MPARPLPALLALSLAATVWSAGLVSPAGAAAGTGCVPPPVAHRGDSAQAPENTLPAFRKALRLGVHRLELDVRFTLGDVPVLMHDTTVDRTTNGTGPIAGLTLDQVRSLDAGAWFSSAYRGTRVPTLYQALTLARSRDAQVMVDLKPRPTPAQISQLLDRFRWTGMGGSIILSSFDEVTISDVRAAAPGLRTAIVDYPRYRRPASVLQFGRTYVVNAASVTEERSLTWRRAGIALRPWTVDRVRGWRRMAHDQASAVITNRPRDYLAWARHRCS